MVQSKLTFPYLDLLPYPCQCTWNQALFILSLFFLSPCLSISAQMESPLGPFLPTSCSYQPPPPSPFQTSTRPISHLHKQWALIWALYFPFLGEIQHSGTGAIDTSESLAASAWGHFSQSPAWSTGRRLGAAKNQLPCGSTGTSSGNCRVREENLNGLGMSYAVTASPKASFRALWKVANAMVSRRNAGWCNSMFIACKWPRC